MLCVEHIACIFCVCDAVFFNDTVIAEQIMAARRPVHQKELGRKVCGYNDNEWNMVCEDIVKKGNMAKVSIQFT